MPSSLLNRVLRPVPGYYRQGDMYARSVKLGRLRLEYTIYRHVYPNCSDRWVIQPCIVYDRKEKECK